MHSCSFWWEFPVQPLSPGAATPIQTVIVLQQIVTQVVTQIVYVPVTITPTPTPYTTDTPTHADTISHADHHIHPAHRHAHRPAAHRNRAGPHPMSLRSRSGLYQHVRHPGEQPADCHRTQPGYQLDVVQGSDHANPCWVKAALVKVNYGQLHRCAGQPTAGVDPLYHALSRTAGRQRHPCRGMMVTIFWLPVPMTEADYNGYLIEAWVCQGGQLVFVPKSYVTSFDKNSTMMAVQCNGRTRLFRAFQRPHLYRHHQCLLSPENVLAWPTRGDAVLPAPPGTLTADCHPHP